jgi:hypothetical protein
MMMKRWMKICSLAMIFCFTMSLNGTPKNREKKLKPDTTLAARIRRFAPTIITADMSRLNARDRRALMKIIEAARLLDPLFLRQVWRGNEALLKRLEQDKTAEGRERLHYFRINNGPWSRLDGNEPFIEGVPSRKKSSKRGRKLSRRRRASVHRVSSTPFAAIRKRSS